MIRFIRTYLAKRRLERMTEERRNSFAIEQYRRNRRAQRKNRREREDRVEARLAAIRARWDRFEQQRKESLG